MGTTILLNLWKRRRRQRGFLPPGTPQAIREALVCWYDPARQGCTNESMAANPVLKDLSGNGHDLALHNFAWSGMSGIGGYGFDIKGTFPRNYTGDPLYVCNDHLINVRSLGKVTGLLQVKNIKTVEDYVEVPPFRIRVSGVADAEKRYPGLHWNNIYYYVDETTKLGKAIDVSADGEYDLPRSVVPDTMQSFLGFVESHSRSVVEAAGGRISVDIRIEIPPSYPGALVADGVDDYCMAEGLPILTDYTVIAKHTNTFTTIDTGWKSFYNKGSANSNGAFKFHRLNRSNYAMEVLSFNGSNWPLDFTDDLVTVITKETYNGQPIRVGKATDGGILRMFTYGSSFSDFALWSFLLFSRTLSEEEIEWVKENMVNGYPSPVAYYDCSKYTNADMGDNPVLEDLSGNGHGLELHNFAFGGMSGFGGYETDSFNEYSVRGSGHVIVNAYKAVINNSTNIFEKVVKNTSIEKIPKQKYKITGITGNGSMNLYYLVWSDGTANLPNVSKRITIAQDGIYELDGIELGKDYGSMDINSYYGFNNISLNDGVSVTIEALPLYPGGLVFDGVDDYGIGSRESFDKCTMFMLFEPLTEKQSISFDARDSGTSHAFDIYRDGRNIAYNTYNANGTYINNILNADKAGTSLVGEKHLVTVKGNIDSGRNYFTLGVHIGKANYFDNMVLYKFLLFDRELTPKQMDKVIRYYGLMEGVDDVWNEDNNNNN